MKNLKCKGWCPPAVIYAVLAVFSTVISLFVSTKYDNIKNNGINKMLYVSLHVTGLAFWTWFLYWLCSNCYQTAAWVVLLFPILLGIALLVFAFVSGVFVNVTKLQNEYRQF